MPEVEGRGEKEQVTGDVGEAAEGRSFVAVGGDGLSDLFDCDIGDLEAIAVGIEKLATLVVGWIFFIQRLNSIFFRHAENSCERSER